MVTLLPAATEIVAALGGAAMLVGVSHECDYPDSVLGLPRLTTTPVDPDGSSATIDAEVRRLRSEGRPVIGVNATALRRLAPDLVVTQGLCEVCAVADGEIHRLAGALEPAPDILSLSATTLDGIWHDIAGVGRALGLERSAEQLVGELQARLAGLRRRAAPAKSRVVCVEWLEPLYLAGHWVPELVEAAGAVDVGALAGAHSAVRSWDEVAALEPEIILVMLCGFGVERARRELDALGHPRGRAFLRSAPVWILDGNAYTSRPGPRVVDGAERIRAALEGHAAEGLIRWTPLEGAA